MVMVGVVKARWQLSNCNQNQAFSSFVLNENDVKQLCAYNGHAIPAA